MSSIAPQKEAPVRVLIIEDDDISLRTIAMGLSTRGFDVQTAANGEDGVAAALEKAPHVIVSDIVMPRMDGYEVLKALRKNPHTAVIPFIFLSGRADRADIRHGMGLGADDYIPKPIEINELIASILARHERQQAVGKKLETLRANIAAAVPNEFLTPLNSILGFSLLLLDTLNAGSAMPREELIDSIGYIQDAGEQLLRIASSYVLYSYLVTSASEPGEAERLRALRAERWEDDLTAKLRARALHYNRLDNIQIILDPAVVAISSEHLTTLLLELADNALKFSSIGSPVRVTGRRHNSRYEIEVRDQGRGMTPAQIESVNALMQFDRAKFGQQGIGLGLAVAMKLADVYGGDFAIKSNAGAGTTIRVQLPATA